MLIESHIYRIFEMNHATFAMMSEGSSPEFIELNTSPKLTELTAELLSSANRWYG